MHTSIQRFKHPVSLLQFFFFFFQIVSALFLWILCWFSFWFLCFRFMYLLFFIHFSSVWSSLYLLTFFSDLFPHQPFFFLSVFCALLSFLAFYSIFLLAFSLHFPLLIFFPACWLMKKYIVERIYMSMIFLWKHNTFTVSQHFNLQYQIVGGFNSIQTKLMHL